MRQCTGHRRNWENNVSKKNWGMMKQLQVPGKRSDPSIILYSLNYDAMAATVAVAAAVDIHVSGAVGFRSC